MASTPTEEAYTALDRAYRHFNQCLFAGRLPNCMFTLHNKGPLVLGTVSPNRFVDRIGTVTHQLTVNPAYLVSRDLLSTLSTLVHEQVHIQQIEFGRPTRRGYHNREWGKMMKRVGLYPSATGQPGGAEVGEMMSHYIVEGGPFHVAARQLIASGFAFNWFEARAVPPRPGTPRPAGGPAPFDLGAEPATGVATERRRPSVAAPTQVPPADRKPEIADTVIPPSPAETRAPATRSGTRTKFACPTAGCRTVAWASSRVALLCGEHAVPLVPVLPRTRRTAPNVIACGDTPASAPARKAL